MHGLVLEQLFRGEVNPGLARPADHLDRDDRVAAQLKEVIGSPNVLQLEYVLPDSGNLLFKDALRCNEPVRRYAKFGSGQGLAVKFAVGSQRQFGQEYQMGWHHVFRQVFPQCCLDRFARRRLSIAICQELVRNEVSHQLLTARPFHCQYRDFLHTVLCQQA